MELDGCSVTSTVDPSQEAPHRREEPCLYRAAGGRIGEKSKQVCLLSHRLACLLSLLSSIPDRGSQKSRLPASLLPYLVKEVHHPRERCFQFFLVGGHPHPVCRRSDRVLSVFVGESEILLALEHLVHFMPCPKHLELVELSFE